MRVRRYETADFEEPIDESTVSLVAGELVVRWGPYTWRAGELREDAACFEPVAAPGDFCWVRVEEGRVDVVQSWTSEDGTPRSQVVPLERLGR